MYYGRSGVSKGSLLFARGARVGYRVRNGEEARYAREGQNQHRASGNRAHSEIESRSVLSQRQHPV